MTYSKEYSKDTLPSTLSQDIETAIPGILKGISYNNSSMKTMLFFNWDPSVSEISQIDSLVNSNAPFSELAYEQYLTETRMKEGFDLYKKIFSHIVLNDPISSIDSFLAIYPQISMLRMLLKDAMFESSYRFMFVTPELTSFTYLDTYKQWVGELVKKHNNLIDDSALAAIAGAPEGAV